ncbi:MAG: DUF2306 domain-containing protein [Candidatus Latescibacteria bacterium]|nr:DUF2306 domain-containing protein [Candidatus Latescibacterota bacterium]
MRKFLSFCLYGLCFGVAGYAAFAYGLLPLGSLVHPDMGATFRANQIGIYTHVFASLIALALGPFQFSERLRTRRLRWHRWSGRAYLGVGVLFGGTAGLYMAGLAYGGVVAKFGFVFLAVGWLYSGLRAYRAIRRRAVEEHQRWMLHNFGLTLAAVTLRIYLPLSMVAGVSFELAYPAIAWLCWVPNLVVAEWLVRKQDVRID